MVPLADVNARTFEPHGFGFRFFGLGLKIFFFEGGGGGGVGGGLGCKFSWFGYLHHSSQRIR